MTGIGPGLALINFLTRRFKNQRTDWELSFETHVSSFFAHKASIEDHWSQNQMMDGFMR